jgi:signal transduction histidine kinase
MSSDPLERHLSFLEELGALLTSSLEPERVLPRVARLSIPLLGDLCAFDLLGDDGRIRREACAHIDLTKEGLAFDARARHGYKLDAPSGAPVVIRSRQPVVVSPATGDDLTRAAQNSEQLEIFRQLGVRSWMIVPMIAREHAMGAVTLVVTESDRRYERNDLLLAQVVASQVAFARASARTNQEADAAREAAEAANRAKDQFLGTLSHELRTPLNAVLGWTSLLQQRQLTTDQEERALQIIRRNVNAQMRIVEDLLDMSRMVSGRIRLVVRPVDLSVIVEQAVDAIRPTADAKSIRLQTVLASPAGPVRGDADRLLQIMWNLISNAVKFTPKHGRVQVQLQHVKSHVEIIVSDTGQGIRPDLLPYIFDRFRQGDGTITRPHGGLGLGLALVRTLVELHSGTVFVESPGEGQGATFVVKLPLMLADQAGFQARSEAAGAASLVPAVSLAGLRLLVVDDDASAVELNQEMLTQAGGEVRTCRDGIEAFQLLQQWRPDVLVSDIEMPGLDGYSLMRKVRALDPDRGGKTLAVALSAFSRPEDRVRSLVAGFNFHVSKPVDPGELITIVASLVGCHG